MLDLNPEVATILSDLSLQTTPRIAVSRACSGETPAEQVKEIIKEIQSTVLPRKVVFRVGEDAILTAIVGSGRLMRIESVIPADLPSGSFSAAAPRESRLESVAEALSAFVLQGGTLSVEALFVDEDIAAEDVGFPTDELTQWIEKNGVTYNRNSRRARLVMNLEGDITDQAGDVSLFPDQDVLNLIVQETAKWREEFAALTGGESCIVVPQISNQDHTLALHLSNDEIRINIYAGDELTPIARDWNSVTAGGTE